MSRNINQSRAAVNSPSPIQLRAAGILAFLVHGGVLPDLPIRTAEAIARSWGVDRSVVETLSLCGYPSEVENILICAEASARFGDLTCVPGFYKQSNIDDGEGEPYDFWRLDLNPKWADSGFLYPVPDRRFGIFTHLLAFRHAKDAKPFTVEVRGDRKAAAA